MDDKVFPDNTVLCNFASVHRIDLLRDWLRGRGRWTEAVESEARKSMDHLPNLTSLFYEGWLGEALITENDDEDTAVRLARTRIFGGRPDEPTKHLGEAMTIVLIEKRPSLRDSWWITDDGVASDYAKERHITTRDTMHVMQELVAEGTITSTAAFALMQTMNDRDRHLRMPTRRQDLE